MSANIYYGDKINPFTLLKGFLITILILLFRIEIIGLPIIFFFLLYIFYRDRLSFMSVILFTVVLMSFFHNDKTIRMENYLFHFFNIRYYGLELESDPYVTILVPFLFIILFILTIPKRTFKGIELFLLLVIIANFLFLLIQNLFFVQFNLVYLFVAFVKFSIIPAGILLYLTLPLTYKNCINQIKNTSFLIGPFQGIIVIGAIFYIISPNGIYNGDYIVGTTSTATQLVYLLSFSLLYYFSFFNYRIKTTIKLFLLFLIIFLAQSGVQAAILVTVGFLIQTIKYIKNRTSNNLLLLILPLIFIIAFLIISPLLFPQIQEQMAYAIRRINELVEFGILKNNKIEVFFDIIEKSTLYNNIKLLFGHGYNTFEIGYLYKYDIQKLFDLSLVTTANTTFLNVFYDFGLLGVISFFTVLFYLGIFLLKRYFQENNEHFLFGLSVILVLIISSFTIFPGFDNYFISIISVIILAPIIKISEKKE